MYRSVPRNGKAKAASAMDEDEDSDVEMDGMDLEGMDDQPADAVAQDGDNEDDDDGMPGKAGNCRTSIVKAPEVHVVGPAGTTPPSSCSDPNFALT